MASIAIINKYGILHTIPEELLPQVLAAGGRLADGESSQATAPEPEPEPAKPARPARKSKA